MRAVFLLIDKKCPISVHCCLYTMDNHTPSPIQVSEARQRFFELLEIVQHSRPPIAIVIEKKGSPVAVLEDYKTHLKHAQRATSPQETQNLFRRIRRFQSKLTKSRGAPPKTDAVTLLRTIREEE